MNNFFNTDHMSSEELQNRLAQHRRSVAARSRHMSMPDPRQAAANAANAQAQAQMNVMADTQMQTGDSLDDIISNSQSELHMRRNSMSHPGYPNAVPNATQQQEPVSAGGQPMNMMNFGGYQQFGQLNTSPTDNGTGNFGNMQEAMEAAMRGNVATSAFAQPNMLAMADQNDYASMGTDMMGGMMNFSNLNMGPMTADPTGLDMFGSPDLDQPHNAGLDPLSTNFSLEMDNNQGQMGSADNAMTGIELDMDPEMMRAPQVFNDPRQQRGPQKQQHLPPARVPTIDTQLQQRLQNAAPLTSPGHANMVMRQQVQAPASAPAVSGAANPLSALPTPTVTNQVPMPAPGVPTPAIGDVTKSKSLYSKSGFDMMRALWYVATRKNAEVQLGAVDMSCAFVVCDVTLNDCPIIYVSDNFQNLTGYSRHEIVGQNCRFLQAPDGRVEAGSKREFVENSAVFNLKRKIAEGKEVQQSLINYRKGGKPFLNLLTMIPIPWDTDDVRYFVGFQIDLVECPDAISGQEMGGVQVNYKHSDIGQYIWNPPAAVQLDRESGQTLSGDDVSTLLQQFNPKGVAGDWHKQTWDKMLLENADDVVHVLSLKGLFMYLSPSCKRVLEYDAADLVGSSLSSICHPSDIVPVTRELKETAAGGPVNIVFRIRRKLSGYTWFESHGSLFVEQGKGRKSIILVGRNRPVFALSRRDLDAHGGIGDSELWTKLSTSGMFLFVSSNVRSLLDLQPETLAGTSIQELMRKESRAEFGRCIEKARRGKIVTCKHEVQNKRGQVLQAQTILYPGDAVEGQKPTFLLAQTKLLKASSRHGLVAPQSTPNAAGATPSTQPGKAGAASTASVSEDPTQQSSDVHIKTQSQASPAGIGASAPAGALPGFNATSQDMALAADDNIFDELKTTRCTSWQYELRQMEKVNRLLAEELGQLLSSKKKRKRRKGVGAVVRDCANCHTRNTPEWRRGPSGQRDLCNSCGLRWAKQTGRVSPRTSSRGGNNNMDAQSKKSSSPIQSSHLHREHQSAVSQAAQPSNLRPPRSGSTDAALASADAASAVKAGKMGSDLPANAGTAGAMAAATIVANAVGAPDPAEASQGGHALQGQNAAGGGPPRAEGQQKLSIPPQSHPGIDPGSGVMTIIREE